MAEEEAPQPQRMGRRLFVGNLAWRTSWQDLKDKFRECGNVVYANVMRDDDGRSKGWGIVEYETVEEATAAMTTLNGVDLGGRRVLVREDREDRDIKQQYADAGEAMPPPPAGGRGRGRGPGPLGGRGMGRGRGRGLPPAQAAAGGPAGESSGLQIVVRGIPWSFSWKELKDLFAEVGEVDRADVMYTEDGRSKGYGIVRYHTVEGATEAVNQMNGYQLEGRSLAVFVDRYA